MGRFIEADIEYSSTGLPNAIHPALTRGTLLLLMPAADAAAAPVDGLQLTNHAAKLAHPLIGGPGHARLVVPAALVAPLGKVERTAKGGLHTLISPTRQMPSGSGSFARYDVQLAEYIRNNLGHSFFFATFGRITRAAVGAEGGTGREATVFSSTPSAAALHHAISVNQSFGAGQGNVRIPAGDHRGIAPQPFYADKLVTGNSGTPDITGTAAAAAGNAFAFGAGRRTGPFNGGTVAPPAGAYESAAYYEHVVEDLTVSGRTYAAASAAWQAAYAARIASIYANDTYTDPTTLG